MHNNRSIGAGGIFKEEIQVSDVDEIVFEDDFQDLICNQFGFSKEVYNRLNECGMDAESLSLIGENELKEIFPTNMLGTRIKFRSQLDQWQKNGAPKPSPIRVRRTAVPAPMSPVSMSPASTPPIVSMPMTIINANNIDQASLFTILQSNSKGQSVLTFYEQNHKLLDDQRVAMISVIVDEFKNRLIPMSMGDIVRFTEEIAVLFPSEDKKYYYSTRGRGRNPMGKLYDKAINARRKLKKTDAVANKVRTQNTQEVLTVATQCELDQKFWLSKNSEPWEEVLVKWKLTFKIRRADILNKEVILQNWSLFKHSMGYELIESDFAELFPDNTEGILNEWPYFRENIIPYLRDRVKDVGSKELMEKLTEDITIDSKDCLILTLLHAVIKPPLLSTPLDGGTKKRKWKPSIADAQNATILHCRDINEYPEIYEMLSFNSSLNTKTMQPMLMVIGEDISKIESFYVLHDTILYKLPTFIKALDILFKLYHVMDIEYRLEAKYLYELIESYCFKINDSSNPNIISVINFLNDNKRKVN